MACKKRMDAKELRRIYTALQNAYALKEQNFNSKEIQHLMKINGIPSRLFSFMLEKGNTYFLVTKKKNACFYSFPKTPIHESLTASLLAEYYGASKHKTYSFSVEEAIAFLKQEGYRVFRDKGIDVQKLKAEMPEIYEQFMRVEEI